MQEDDEQVERAHHPPHSHEHDARYRALIESLAEHVPHQDVQASATHADPADDATQAARQTAEDLERFFSAALDLFCIADTDGHFRRLNPAWESALGHPLVELESFSFLDLVHVDDRAATVEALARLRHQEEVLSFTNRYRHKDGSYRWIEWRALPFGDLVFAAARDITERRRTETALRERVKELTCLLELSHILDARDLKIPDLLRSAVAILPAALQHSDVAVARIELEGAEYTAPQSVPTPVTMSAPLVVQGQTSGAIEVGYRKWPLSPAHKAAGREEPFLDEERALLESVAERIGHTVERLRLAQAQREAEKDLVESESRYRALVEHSSSGVVVYEPTPDGQDFIIREFNRAAEDIEQVPRQDVIGKRVTEAFPGAESFGILDVFRRVHQTGRSEKHPVALYEDDRLTSWRDNYVYQLPTGEIVATYQNVTDQVATARALSDAKDLLDRTQAISKAGGWEYDVASRTMAFTDEVYRIHGVDPDSFDPNDIDRDVAFYAPADAPMVHEAFRRAVEDGEDYDIEARFIRADGQTIWVRTVGVPQLENGRVVRVTGNILDITDRKVAEEALRASEERARLMADLVENSDQPIGIGYSDGRMGRCNPAFCQLTGYTEEELRGMDWTTQLTPPEWLEAEREALAALDRTGVPARYEKEYLRKDGTRVPVELLTHLVRDDDGAPKFYYAFVTDITERKRAARAIARLNAELEQRVRDRTLELQAANKELEAFAYTVSHDLRAPLRHASGFAKLLQEHLGDKLDDETRHYLERIDSAVVTMGALIDDLLQLSRTSRVDLVMSEVDMGRLAHATLTELLAEHPSERLTSRVHRLPHVRSDEALLRIVWRNLLENAIKFTSPHPTGHIEVGSRKQADEVVYWVRDDGVGFDPQYADKMFGVFQRLHPGIDLPGTGVGLATVQRIVTRLGGHTWAEGAPNAGATIYFALPSTRR